MNRNTVGTLFNMLENVATENNLSDTTGNILNIYENGRQVTKPAFVITEKCSKNVDLLTSGEMIETVTMIACCNTASQFLPPVVIFKDVYRKQEFSDGLNPGSDMYMNRSSYIRMDLSGVSQNTFSNPKTLGKALLLDGHRTSCSLLETAVENNFIFIRLPSHSTRTLQPLDKCIFGAFK